MDRRWSTRKCLCNSYKHCTYFPKDMSTTKDYKRMTLTEYWYLVWYPWASFRAATSNTAGHAFIELVKGLLQEVVPLILKGLPHLILIAREWVPSTPKVVQLVSYMFYDVHVWWQGWPRENSDLPFLEPVPCNMQCVLWVIVLLKDNLALAYFLQFLILESA